MLKIQYFKNPKRSFVRNIEKVIKDNLDKFWLWFVEVVFVWEIAFSEKSQVH